MKGNKEITGGLLIALAVYLWAKKSGALDSLPVIGPFFWPTAVPADILEWKETVNNATSGEWTDVILAIIWQESNGVHYLEDGSVIRGADAEIGLCQILPSTGLGLGFTESDLMDPIKNIQACEAYIVEAFNAWNKWYEENPGNGVTAIHDLFRYYNGGPRVVLDHDTYINLSRNYADQTIHKFELLLKGG